LRGFHDVTLLNVQRGDPAGELCINIDLIGFQPAIAEGDAGG
jgi:hypothetical protein